MAFSLWFCIIWVSAFCFSKRYSDQQEALPRSNPRAGTPPTAHLPQFVGPTKTMFKLAHLLQCTKGRTRSLCLMVSSRVTTGPAYLLQLTSRSLWAVYPETMACFTYHYNPIHSEACVCFRGLPVHHRWCLRCPCTNNGNCNQQICRLHGLSQQPSRRRGGCVDALFHPFVPQEMHPTVAVVPTGLALMYVL
jgi:hypothetical protein